MTDKTEETASEDTVAMAISRHVGDCESYLPGWHGSRLFTYSTMKFSQRKLSSEKLLSLSFCNPEPDNIASKDLFSPSCSLDLSLVFIRKIPPLLSDMPNLLTLLSGEIEPQVCTQGWYRGRHGSDPPCDRPNQTRVSDVFHHDQIQLQ